MTMAEFIDMGGQGFYVWTSYGVGLLIFVALYFAMTMQQRKLIGLLKRRYRQDQRKRESQGQKAKP